MLGECGDGEQKFSDYAEGKFRAESAAELMLMIWKILTN